MIVRMEEPGNEDDQRASEATQKELQERFPGVKFSITSSTFSIKVRWTDFPTIDAVNEIATKYQHIDTCPVTGEVLAGGNTYVFCDQSISADLREKIEERMPEGVTKRHTNYHSHKIRILRDMWAEQTGAKGADAIEREQAMERINELRRSVHAAAKRAHMAMEAHRSLPAGSSRACLTSAYARWMAEAEERDRLHDILNKAVVALGLPPERMPEIGEPNTTILTPVC